MDYLIRAPREEHCVITKRPSPRSDTFRDCSTQAPRRENHFFAERWHPKSEAIRNYFVLSPPLKGQPCHQGVVFLKGRPQISLEKFLNYPGTKKSSLRNGALENCFRRKVPLSDYHQRILRLKQYFQRFSSNSSLRKQLRHWGVIPSKWHPQTYLLPAQEDYFDTQKLFLNATPLGIISKEEPSAK